MVKTFWLFFPFLSLFFISCQSQLNLNIHAAQNINPDISTHGAAPVLIQIYQLKDAQKFQNSTFFEITDNPEKALGADYLGIFNNLMISPLQTLDIPITLNPEAKYMGIIAAFQSINSSTWKVIIPIDGKNKKKIEILVNNKNIHLKPNK